jgi:hypothetical protein
MEIIKDFLPKDLYTDLLDYSKICTYRKVEDNIYNFKSCNIVGDLFKDVEALLRKYNLVGEIEKLRIQRIDSTVRMTERFHYHHVRFKENLVCFLNENFSGGEFEYKDESIIKVMPEVNTALIFEPKTLHRVLPVTEGERYTLVAFLTENTYINKEENTLI